MIVFERFPIGAVAGQSGFSEFHPVLEFHTGKIAFAPGKWSIRKVASRWIWPSFATAFQRKSNRRVLHKDRMSKIVIGIDTVQFVKTRSFPLT